MVAISRALAISPSLILLDKALEGLAPIVRNRLIKAIKKIKGPWDHLPHGRVQYS